MLDSKPKKNDLTDSDKDMIHVIETVYGDEDEAKSLIKEIVEKNTTGKVIKPIYPGRNIIVINQGGGGNLDPNDPVIKNIIKNTHERNTDNRLVNIGPSDINNISNGDIIHFKSKGNVVAAITDSGKFTGTIDISNVNGYKAVDLDDYYTKIQIEDKLKEKTNNSRLFDPSTNLIKDDLLSVNISRTSDLNDHISDATKHATITDKDKWDKKYDKPLTGIPKTDLSADIIDILDHSLRDSDILEVNGKIKESVLPDIFAKKVDVSAHIDNVDIHVTKESKLKWDGKADGKEVNDHISNVDIHMTALERESWNKKYDKPLTGIPQKDLEIDLSKKINDAVPREEILDSNGKIKTDLLQLSGVYASTQELENHASNTEVHVTNGDKIGWNNKYYVDKSVGIPKKDLSQEIKDELSTVESHMKDLDIHIKADERIEWSKKYLKPALGIPIDDLTDELKDKINSMAYDDSNVRLLINNNKVAIDELKPHVTNDVVHITTPERTKWNDKYSKPIGGIPKKDLDDELNKDLLDFLKRDEILLNGKIKSDLIPTSVDTVSVDTFNKHVNNLDTHITLEEKARIKDSLQYNDIFFKDVDNNVILEKVIVDSKLVRTVDLTELNDHKANSTIHVTDVDKTEWSKKYNKPVDGVPISDLNSEIVDKLNNMLVKDDVFEADGSLKGIVINASDIATKTDLDTHTNNLEIHTTKGEKLANLEHIADLNIHTTKLDKDKIDEHLIDTNKHLNLDEKHTIAMAKSHISDVNVHVTKDEKDKWNNFNSNVDLSELNRHKDDLDIHVTLLEKTAWNKLVTDGLDLTELNNHIKNLEIHTTTVEKNKWDNKYDKPLLGIPISDMKDSDIALLKDHNNMTNIGTYTHSDIDNHLDNDLIHNNNSLGKWTFEGQVQMNTAQKDHIKIDSSFNAILDTDISTGKYYTNGTLTTEVFDTVIADCPFTSLFFFGNYEYGVTSIKIQSRTGKVADPDSSWETWKDLETNGKIVSSSNRYIQIKLSFATSNISKTPKFNKFHLFFGVNTNDAIKEAQGSFPSMDARFKSIETLATHSNRLILDKIDDKMMESIELFKKYVNEPFIKLINSPTTHIEIPISEHKISYADTSIYSIKFFVKVNSNYQEYIPKEVYVVESNKTVIIEFSTDIPVSGKLIIK